MTDPPTILVPIRYPLTDQSAQTLVAAGRLAHERASADLMVLHVNLFQTEDNTRTEDLTRAISSTLDGVEASVITRRGFLVEEVILEEAMQLDADIVVVGTNQQATWRQLLSRLLRNDPAVGTFLRENAPREIEIMEVGTAVETPPAKAM